MIRSRLRAESISPARTATTRSRMRAARTIRSTAGVEMTSLSSIRRVQKSSRTRVAHGALTKCARASRASILQVPHKVHLQTQRGALKISLIREQAISPVRVVGPTTSSPAARAMIRFSAQAVTTRFSAARAMTVLRVIRPRPSTASISPISRSRPRAISSH